jgi:uncharacterized protein YkwD
VSFRTVFSVILGTLLVACGAPHTATSPAALPTARVLVPPAPLATVRPATPTSQGKLLLMPTLAPAASTAPTLIPAPTITPTSPSNEVAQPVAGAPPHDPALLEALLVVEINRERAAHGMPPYLHSPELSAAARAHSCDLAAHTMISHTSSDGRTLTHRLAGNTPPWEWPSESIAAGTDDPATVVAWWMDEPPEGWHRRNILDPDQREVGVGYCYTAEDPTGNRHYWTADFSRRASQ